MPRSGKILSGIEIVAKIENLSVANRLDHGALSGLSDNDHPQYALTSGLVFPEADSRFVNEATEIVGSTTLQVNTNMYHNMVAFWGSQNDEFELKFYLAAGTYKMSILGLTNNSSGIAEIKLDTVLVATLDWYTGAQTFNVIKQTTGVVIASNKVVTLNCKTTDKHASSFGYQIRLTKIWFEKTG